MFQVNTPGYEPCDMEKRGSVVLNDDHKPHWKSVATAWGLQASPPVEAHPNCDRVCSKHRAYLGVGFPLKKGVLTRKPDTAILELECVACHQQAQYLTFATPEMQMAINEDNSVTAGISCTKRKGPLVPRLFFNLTQLLYGRLPIMFCFYSQAP
jgi:hypothetical protein